MKTLSEFEKYVLLEKGTEAPFSGEYNDFFVRWNLCMQNV